MTLNMLKSQFLEILREEAFGLSKNDDSVRLKMWRQDVEKFICNELEKEGIKTKEELEKKVERLEVHLLNSLAFDVRKGTSSYCKGIMGIAKQKINKINNDLLEEELRRESYY